MRHSSFFYDVEIKANFHCEAEFIVSLHNSDTRCEGGEEATKNT